MNLSGITCRYRMKDLAEIEVLLDRIELPRVTREYVEANLKTEDALLLEKFTELIDQKPVSYTFMI